MSADENLLKACQGRCCGTWHYVGLDYQHNDTAWNAAIEAAAKVAESYEPECESCPRGVASAIRALRRGGGGS